MKKNILVFTSALLFMLTGMLFVFSMPREEARAVLQGKSGRKVTGEVLFFSTQDGVRIYAEVEGLAPLARHGFHIHEKGDCSAFDASTAGEHFNPFNSIHGHPHLVSHHAGDLGNLVADDFGRAVFDEVIEDISLDPEKRNSVVGLAVIVHNWEDDFLSQPDGNSGVAIACGIIR